MNHALTLASLAAAGMLASCATPAGDRDALSEDAARRLAEFDRTGERDNCLGLRSISEITPLSEKLFLVRVGVSSFYLNEVKGRCSGADDSFSRLQYTTSLSQLCRNEIITVVDNSSGITQGSCGLGDFERLEKKPEPAAR